MKFLCVDCDARMDFAERQVPGDGTLAAVFECPGCGRAVAMLTNPMETQLVSSLGVKIGGREVDEQPLEATRSSIASGRDDAFEEPGVAERDPSAGGPRPPAEGAPGRDDAGAAAEGRAGARRVTWSTEAETRLQRVPRFVRGMVHRIYTDWAKERGIREITPEVMDRARTDLGLEGM